MFSFSSVVIHAGGHSVEDMLPVEVGVCWGHAGGGAEVHLQPTCRMGGRWERQKFGGRVVDSVGKLPEHLEPGSFQRIRIVPSGWVREYAKTSRQFDRFSGCISSLRQVQSSTPREVDKVERMSFW